MKGVPRGTRWSGRYLTCAGCQKPFWAQQSYIDRGRKYCSKSCSDAALRTCATTPCSECGTRLARARGLCAACYQRYRKRVSPEARRKDCERSRHYAQAHKQQRSEYYRRRHSAVAFGGADLQCLERDGLRCADCGTVGNTKGSRLDVHHIDGRGHVMPVHERDNDLSNLVTLCRSCHMRRHTTQARRRGPLAGAWPGQLRTAEIGRTETCAR